MNISMATLKKCLKKAQAAPSIPIIPMRLQAKMKVRSNI